MQIIAVTKLLTAVISGAAGMNPVTLAAAGAIGLGAGCLMLASDSEKTSGISDSVVKKRKTDAEQSAGESLCSEESNLREDGITARKQKKSIRRAVGKMLVIIGGLALTAAVGVTVIKWLHPLPSVPIQDVIAEVPKIKEAAKGLKELEGPINEIKEIVVYSEETVKSFLRKLPAGQHASISKIQEAAELGIALPEGYTLVDSFTRTRSIVAAA